MAAEDAINSRWSNHRWLSLHRRGPQGGTWNRIPLPTWNWYVVWIRNKPSFFKNNKYFSSNLLQYHNLLILTNTIISTFSLNSHLLQLPCICFLCWNNGYRAKRSHEPYRSARIVFLYKLQGEAGIKKRPHRVSLSPGRVILQNFLFFCLFVFVSFFCYFLGRSRGIWRFPG